MILDAQASATLIDMSFIQPASHSPGERMYLVGPRSLDAFFSPLQSLHIAAKQVGYKRLPHAVSLSSYRLSVRIGVRLTPYLLAFCEWRR